MPAAMSIWLSTQPPKMWPLALMSAGPGMTRRIGTRSRSVIPSPPHRECVAAASSCPLDRAHEHQRHQRRAEQHGEPDPERGRDEHVGRGASRSPRVTSTTAIAATTTDSSASSRKIRQKRRFIDGAGLGIGSGVGHGFPLAARSGTIKPTERRVSGGSAMTIAAVLQEQGQRGRDDRRPTPACSMPCAGSARSGSARFRWSRTGGSSASSPSATSSIACATTAPDALDWPVARVMSSPAITVDPRDGRARRLALMTERRIRHLPVVDGGEIRGIVSIGDLVKYRMERIEAEADAMRAYIQSA